MGLAGHRLGLVRSGSGERDVVMMEETLWFLSVYYNMGVMGMFRSANGVVMCSEYITFLLFAVAVTVVGKGIQLFMKVIDAIYSIFKAIMITIIAGANALMPRIFIHTQLTDLCVALVLCE